MDMSKIKGIARAILAGKCPKAAESFVFFLKIDNKRHKKPVNLLTE